MNSRERVRAAMQRDPVDRVPVMCQFSIGHMLVQLGVSPAEFWCDPGVFVDGLFAMREMYDFDGILVSLHGHDPAWRERIASRSATGAAEEILWVDGSRTLFPRDELPRQLAALASQTAGPAAPAGSPIDFIPVSQGLRFAIHPRHRFEVLEEAVARSAGRYSIHGEITSPFDYVLDQEGHQNALLSIVDDPGSLTRLLEYYTSRVAALAEDMCDTGIDAVKISSPYAGAGFISPACYRDFILPHERRLIGAIRAKGVKAYIHTCGAIRDRLGMMIESGADGIECLDPPPLGNIELEEALRQIGGRCFVKGNIDSVNLLLRGSAEEIRQDARQRVKAGKGSGGFILSTACSIAPHVPRESVRLLREVVDEAE
jgi:uroporphyrinogen-III decarboxylase